jgi:hypothetical protein
MMKKISLNKWLKALESGEYEQTRNQLTNNRGDAFCCLGVACNEAGMVLAKEYYDDGWHSAPGWHFIDESNLLSFHMDDTYVLESVLEKKDVEKLKKAFGVRYIDDVESYLASMNDEGESFKEIAKEIRSRLRSLKK